MCFDDLDDNNNHHDDNNNHDDDDDLVYIYIQCISCSINARSIEVALRIRVPSSGERRLAVARVWRPRTRRGSQGWRSGRYTRLRWHRGPADAPKSRESEPLPLDLGPVLGPSMPK